MLGDETMDAIRPRDDDPADIPIMWMWSVGCLGWGLWKRVAYLSITLALDCDFFLCACLCFRLAVGLDFVVFFGLRYPLPSTGGWAYIFSAGLV
jgi:hypothetical protein